MIGGTKAIKTLIAATTVISLLTLSAYSGLLGNSAGSGPPVETHPKVDENAYKAASERMPQEVWPWGIAHPSEPASVGKKSNQDMDKVQRTVAFRRAAPIEKRSA
jgi:hypothetical protein